jgi:hypothetical protein
MNLALLWLPSAFVDRRQAALDSGFHRLFPSWSWAGWIGGVQYEPGSVGEKVYRPEVTNFSVKPDIFISDCLFGASNTWKCDVLEFESSSANFFVANGEAVALDDGAGSRICQRMYDLSSNHCGLAYGFDPNFLEGSPGRWFECLLLSRRIDFEAFQPKRRGAPMARRAREVTIRSRDDALKEMMVPVAEIEWPERGTVTDFDEKVYQYHPWQALDVMIIQREGSSATFATRVALGQIHEDAWTAASPQTKFFQLI